MRSLIAGTDASGKSCIIGEVAVQHRDPHEGGRSHRTDVFNLRETPPPERPPGVAQYHETGLEPGHLDFVFLQMPANIEHPMHHTDTLNFHTVVEGELEVLLDLGAYRLECGDSLVMPGIDHGWRAGPEGCTMMILNLGSIRP